MSADYSDLRPGQWVAWTNGRHAAAGELTQMAGEFYIIGANGVVTRDVCDAGEVTILLENIS